MPTTASRITPGQQSQHSARRPHRCRRAGLPGYGAALSRARLPAGAFPRPLKSRLPAARSFHRRGNPGTDRSPHSPSCYDAAKKSRRVGEACLGLLPAGAIVQTAGDRWRSVRRRCRSVPASR